MRIARKHPGTQQLFALLTLADLSLTWWLLSGTPGRVYESNPLARWWLEEHGWLGLAAFKCGMALLVLGLAAVIARRRPRAGGGVLGFGCVILTLVVLYSAYLCFAPPLPGRAGGPVAGEAGGNDPDVPGEMRRKRAYRALRGQVGEEVSAGRMTLREATDRLAASELGRDPAWLRVLAFCYQGRPPRECLAADLIRSIMKSRDEGSEGGQQLVGRLEREFERTFGSALPPRVGTLPPAPGPRRTWRPRWSRSPARPELPL